MTYSNIIEAVFIKRVNRFTAHVLVNGKQEVAHVKNTGRCKELFICGVCVFLREEDNPARKTRYTLISIYKNNMLINIDSQIPNVVVYESLENGLINGIFPSRIMREQRYKDSRFDIKFLNGCKEAFMEVKGVTLEVGGTAKFPDAPTVRGTKHINHLIDAVNNGYEAYVFFLIQMEGINKFVPNWDTDPAFAKALKHAADEGVHILCYNSIVSSDSILLGSEVEIII